MGEQEIFAARFYIERSPEQQLQQQVEAWQAMRSKLGGNESAIVSRRVTLLSELSSDGVAV